MQWSTDQQTAIAAVAAWMRIKYAPFFYLAGFAGSGKTTLARHIASLQKGRVAYAAFTGKAAKVMRKAGCTGARTIHSLIYRTEIDDTTGERTYTLEKDALDDVSLIVIDECSMVNEELALDLLSYNVPILVLGDPGQLPPVAGAGYFTSGNPTYMLTEIHRQAAGSPIIRVATEIREGTFRRQAITTEGLVICRRDDLAAPLVTNADAIIVGRNKTRYAFNRRLREIRGFASDFPQVGETLICLRNDQIAKITNGETFIVEKKGRKGKVNTLPVVRYDLGDPDDDTRTGIKVAILEAAFQGPDALAEIGWKQRRGTHDFDFGYALTAHKAQGSQWSNVCVFDESGAFREDARRWLYTAVTRAADHLTLVI